MSEARRPRSEYWTPVEAQQVLDRLAASGLSIRAFARKEDLCAERVRWWLRRLAAPAPGGAQLVELVLAADSPVVPAPTSDQSVLLRIRCPSGHVIEMSDLPAEQALVAALGALRTIAC